MTVTRRHGALHLHIGHRLIVVTWTAVTVTTRHGWHTWHTPTRTHPFGHTTKERWE